MSLWTLEPRDTLVLRDGRPIRGDGLQMKSLPLPYPSAVAGFFRTRSATDAQGRFVHAGDHHACRELLKLPVAGPWLCVEEDGDLEHLLPRPLDALFFPVKDQPEQVEIVPLGRKSGPSLADGELTDLAEESADLELVFASERKDEKPARPVALWRWAQLRRWLVAPRSMRGAMERSALGFDHAPIESRTSVKIAGETQTAEEGALFTIDHRRYQLAGREGGLAGARRLKLIVSCNAEITAGTFPFAGERRLVHLQPSSEKHPDLPAEVADAVVSSGRLRLMLITPAVFEDGWRPKAILGDHGGVKVEMRAAIVPRPEVVSGWNMLKRVPKPTRRLVPAGAIYYLKLDGDEGAIRNWLKEHWWRAVSDDPQDRLDGFGVCALGADATIDKEEQQA